MATAATSNMLVGTSMTLSTLTARTAVTTTSSGGTGVYTVTVAKCNSSGTCGSILATCTIATTATTCTGGAQSLTGAPVSFVVGDYAQVIMTRTSGSGGSGTGGYSILLN